MACYWLMAALPYAAHAQTGSDDHYFKDWITLSDYLRSRGVDPVIINWGAIEPMCLGIKTNDSQIEYNRCKYQKALDQSEFGPDSAGCDTQSRAEYSAQLKFRQPLRTVTVADKTGTQKVIEETAPALTGAELKDLRRASYIKCMRQLGWSNPDDWLRGRRQ